jgi:hypothetical protein
MGERGTERKQAFVADLEKQHGGRPRSFSARGLRDGTVNLADPVQEM